MKTVFKSLVINVSILILSFLSTESIAQNYFYKTFSWEKQPKVYVPAESEKQSELVLVKDFTVLEGAYDKDGQAVIFETHHRIYHINNQKGIEQVNKVYISTDQVNEELDIKARCITAANKVIPFNSDNVKHVDNLDNAGPYTIFSIDGVDVGCDVEYYYTNKRSFFPYALYRVNNSLPISSYEFTLISPKNLIYESKSFNGLNAFVKDTTDKTKNTMRLTQSNIQQVEEEKYSSTNANKPAFCIQLAYNTDKSNAKFYTWETIAKGYYNNLFVSDKVEQKVIEKFLEKNKITKQATPEAKIIALENVLKLQYNVSSSNGNLPINKALDTKNLDEVTALKMYIYAFNFMKIPVELVITSDRMNKKFDGKFPTQSFLDDILFYFPEINKYTSPLEILSRLDFPNPNNAAIEGLFIKEIVLGDIGMPSSKIKQIMATDYTKSYHNLDIKTKINPSTLVATLDVEQNLMGYSAYYVQPIYDLLNDEQKKDVTKNYYTIDKPESVKNLVISNTDKESILTKPMKMTYTQELGDVVESAGDKFIFKVGELIGMQSELYQEKKRVSDGDIYYAHYFKRTLEIEIPDGYKIDNLEDLKLTKTCVIDGKEVAQFKSEYKIEGKKLVVTAYEDYRAIKYPLVNFDEFKSVINAAADFNKKSLVFSKN